MGLDTPPSGRKWTSSGGLLGFAPWDKAVGKQECAHACYPGCPALQKWQAWLALCTETQAICFCGVALRASSTTANVHLSWTWPQGYLMSMESKDKKGKASPLAASVGNQSL